MAIVLATDGGPHKPDAWAVASAELIIAGMVSPGVTHPLSLQKLQVAIADALVAPHASVQEMERARLALGDDHLLSPLDPSPHADELVAAVLGAADGTEYAAHFAKPETVDYVRLVVTQHIVDAQHIERLWHTDRNPSAVASAYRAQHGV